MRGIRQAVTCLCLATIFSATVPSLAESGEACQAEEIGNTAVVHPLARLNLAELKTMPVWSAQAMASSESPGTENVQTQTSGKGWSSYSAAKKTWIIVGSVMGAAVIVAAVSSSGDGGGGGY